MDQALDARYYSSQGDRYKDESNHTQAIINYKRALSLQPKDYSLHLGWGRALVDQDYSLAARLKWREIVRMDPDDQSALFVYGFILSTLEEYAESEEIYTKCLDISVKLPEVYVNLAIVKMKLCKYEEALLACEEAFIYIPDEYYGRCLRGYLEILQGRYEDAIIKFEEAIKINSDLYLASFHKILALWCLDKEDEGYEIFFEMKSKAEDLGIFHEQIKGLIGPYESELERLRFEEVDPDVDDEQQEANCHNVRGLKFVIKMMKRELD